MNGRTLIAGAGTMTMMLIQPAMSEARTKHVEQPAEITVRVYQSSIGRMSIGAASRYAARKFRSAGVAVTFVECRTNRDACLRPLTSTDLILRLTPATDANAVDKERSLGFAFVDAATRASRVATVYPERVVLLARRARVDETDLLGRAVAHEIGHLLIQSNQHAPDGLMRAHWTIEELRRNLPRDWSFSRDEGRVMHGTVVLAAANGRGESQGQLESRRDDTTDPTVAARLAWRDSDDVAVPR
jgi:hypothetical protein